MVWLQYKVVSTPCFVTLTTDAAKLLCLRLMEPARGPDSLTHSKPKIGGLRNQIQLMELAHDQVRREHLALHRAWRLSKPTGCSPVQLDMMIL